MDYERFPIPEGYTFVQHLGSSSAGTSEVVANSAGKLFVCREILKEHFATHDDIQHFKEHIDHVQTIHSPFIIPYKLLVDDDVRIILLRHYFPEGSILENIDALCELGPERIYSMWIMLVKTIHTLHEHHLAPNLIKPSNLFLYKGSCIVMTDLCHAHSHSNFLEHTPNPSDMAFLAPEFFSDTKIAITGNADTWSLGIVLAFLLTANIPFNTKNIFTMVNQIKTADLEFSSKVPDGLLKLIKSMVVVDPAKRKPLEDVINVKPKEVQGHEQKENGNRSIREFSSAMNLSAKTSRNLSSQVSLSNMFINTSTSVNSIQSFNPSTTKDIPPMRYRPFDSPKK